jgi:hypothetical protein
MRLGTLATTLSCAALIGCADTSAPAEDLSGTYDYVAQRGGVDVVAGTMWIQVQEDRSVTGSWELMRVPNSDTTIAVGPQLGSGTLAGRRTVWGLWLDLNPGWADNNVMLSLSPQSFDALVGTWDHVTIVGPATGGPVRLRRLVR